MAILRNAVKCNRCGEIIESRFTHDFQTCKCGAVSVDGGHSYLRRAFQEDIGFTELSEVTEDKEGSGNG